MLLRAARELLDSGGPGALSVRDIAARAGVAPMGVYKRFGSKAGILDALLTSGFDELAAAVAPPDADFAPGQELALLAGGMARYRAFALANPSMYALMFDHPDLEAEPSEAAMAAARHAFDELVDGMRLAIAARQVVAGDPVDLAQQVWGACHGAVSLELRGISFATADPAAHYAALVDTVLRGLRSDGS